VKASYDDFEDDEYERRPSERGRSGMRLMAAALILCLLIGGGGLGIGIHYLIEQNNAPITVSEPYVSPTPTATARAADNSVAETKAPRAPLTDGSALTAPEIFAQSVDSCVGISVEITVQDDWFGPQTGTISGSGFVISSDGYIVTNNHVVEDAYNSGLDVKISMHDGTEYNAVVVGAEPANDVALLKIEPAAELTPLPIGSLDNMRVGEEVYVIGNPLGYLSFTMTGGMLSAFDREIHTDSLSDTGIKMFQISAQINKGNSGGPVFNDRGEVIGIASAKSGETSVEGLGFAIPMDDVRGLIAEWQEKGYRPRPVLGVSVRSIDGRDRNNGRSIKGAGVIEIVPGGAAELAGIELGDVITKIDKHEIQSHSDLIAYMRKNYGAGDTAVLTVYRYVDGKGEDVELTVTFAESNPQVEESPTPNLPDYFN
jgi:serine protease Do